MDYSSIVSSVLYQHAIITNNIETGRRPSMPGLKETVESNQRLWINVIDGYLDQIAEDMLYTIDTLIDYTHAHYSLGDNALELRRLFLESIISSESLVYYVDVGEFKYLYHRTDVVRYKVRVIPANDKITAYVIEVGTNKNHGMPVVYKHHISFDITDSIMKRLNHASKVSVDSEMIEE